MNGSVFKSNTEKVYRCKKPANGFSLVELSIVLIIIGLIAGTSVAPLTNSLKQVRYQRTEAQLSDIREALLGYMISAGRLPCPVRLNRSGSAVPSSSRQVCPVQHGGVPAAELGVVGQQSAEGALLDAWGHRFQYSVSFSDHADRGQPGLRDWLTSGEPAAVGASNLSADFNLCRRASSTACPKRDLIASQIVWVVYSFGESDLDAGLEAENRDDDTVFAVGPYSSRGDQVFDDQIIWASRSELVYWLLKANWLP